jgi:hypothetical protein
VSSPQPLFVRILWFVRKPKWWVERILFVSTWAFELFEAIFVAFVTLRGEASQMARCRPRAPKVVVSCGKVCEGPLRLPKERSKSYWSGESGWKRPSMELALGGQLKLPQWRRRDHGWWFWTSANKSSCQLFGLPSCVLAIQIAWVIHCLYWFYRLHA